LYWLTSTTAPRQRPARNCARVMSSVVRNSMSPESTPNPSVQVMLLSVKPGAGSYTAAAMVASREAEV
jgi:hypothetical protein